MSSHVKNVTHSITKVAPHPALLHIHKYKYPFRDLRSEVAKKLSQLLVQKKSLEAPRAVLK